MTMLTPLRTCKLAALTSLEIYIWMMIIRKGTVRMICIFGKTWSQVPRECDFDTLGELFAFGGGSRSSFLMMIICTTAVVNLIAIDTILLEGEEEQPCL